MQQDKTHMITIKKHKRMKILKNVILIIWVLFLSSCYMFYDRYILEPISKSNILVTSLGFSAIQPSIYISFLSESDKPIKDIEIKSLFIQTGDINIEYDENRLVGYTKKLNQLYQEKNEVITNYFYETSFRYDIDKYVGEKIKAGKITDFKIVLEYILVLDDGVITNIIEQDYKMRVKRSIERVSF